MCIEDRKECECVCVCYQGLVVQGSASWSGRCFPKLQSGRSDRCHSYTQHTHTSIKHRLQLLTHTKALIILHLLIHLLLLLNNVENIWLVLWLCCIFVSNSTAAPQFIRITQSDKLKSIWDSRSYFWCVAGPWVKGLKPKPPLLMIPEPCGGERKIQFFLLTFHTFHLKPAASICHIPP